MTAGFQTGEITTTCYIPLAGLRRSCPLPTAENDSDNQAAGANAQPPVQPAETLQGFCFQAEKVHEKQAKDEEEKRKAPIVSVMLKRGAVYYTHAYEKLGVVPENILLESKHGEDIAGNIFALLKELSREKYGGYKVMLAVQPSLKPAFKKLLDRYGIKNVNMIDIFTREYDKALATAKYLITDTSFPPYFIKKEQVYLNTWHGTPLKAMGRIVRTGNMPWAISSVIS